MKIHNIPEEITTDNIEDTLIAQNPDTGTAKGEFTPKFTYETKRHTRKHSNRGQFRNYKETDT